MCPQNTGWNGMNKVVAPQDGVVDKGDCVWISTNIRSLSVVYKGLFSG